MVSVAATLPTPGEVASFCLLKFYPRRRASIFEKGTVRALIGAFCCHEGFPCLPWLCFGEVEDARRAFVVVQRSLYK